MPDTALFGVCAAIVIVGNVAGRWLNRRWHRSHGLPTDRSHVHCDHDPVECSVEALQGEYAEVKRQRDEYRALLGRAVLNAPPPRRNSTLVPDTDD